MYHKEHGDIHDKTLSQQWQFEALKKPMNKEKKQISINLLTDCLIQFNCKFHKH